MNASYYIQHLQLQKHPEGGYYKENYRSLEWIEKESLPGRFAGKRNFSTAIYYLLEQGDFSAFHRIKSDECWHFYAGGSLLIHVIEETGQYYSQPIGSGIDTKEVFQFVVPAGAWFAAEPAKTSEFSLVGCTVAPAFDFADFEMAKKYQMLELYPQHERVIEKLCRI